MPQAKPAHIPARHREQLSEIMTLAWSLFRTEKDGPEPRSFADALKGAWRWMKGRAARMAAHRVVLPGAGSRHVSFGSMIASPIRRAARGPYAGVNAARAGYLTSSVGR